MKKMKLQVQELAVESFSLTEADGELGTVHGQEVPTPPYKTCPAATRLTYDCPCTPRI